MQKIVIEIDENAQITIEGHGIVGPECERLTKELEAALGVVTERTKKPEYAQRETTVARKARA